MFQPESMYIIILNDILGYMLVGLVFKYVPILHCYYTVTIGLVTRWLPACKQIYTDCSRLCCTQSLGSVRSLGDWKGVYHGLSLFPYTGSMTSLNGAATMQTSISRFVIGSFQWGSV